MAYTDRVTGAFTVGADTSLGSYTPDTGTGFTLIGLSSGPPTVIASDDTLCHPFSSGALGIIGGRAEFGGTWTDDQQAEATGWAGPSTALGIGTRIQNDGAGEPDGYRGLHSAGAGRWEINRVDSKVETNLGTFVDGSPSDANVIILQSEGNTHKLFEDGVERISASDSTYPTGGGPGTFTQRSIASAGIDNFVGRDQGGGERRWLFGA